MNLLFVTHRRILRLREGEAEAFPAEELLTEEGYPRYERLLHHLRELGGRGAYVGLGPEFALLRLQPFPSLQGFPLEEAVLAEAERSPLFAEEELLADYLLVAPEDERRVRVLFAALPRRGAGLLARLRPARVEPLPLLLWRHALSQSEAPSLLVLENLAHTVALFENGVLRGFRYLTLPADEGSAQLAEEVARSLALFGHAGAVDQALLLGLPTPPPVPPGLPAREVAQGVPLDLEAQALAKGFSLDLKPRRKALGEGLPREAQWAVFLAALFFVGGLVGKGLLEERASREERRAEALRQQVELLRAQTFQPARPRGLGLEEVLKVASERPENLWLTSLTAEQTRLHLEGKALDPYAPLLLARRLGGKPGVIQAEGEGRLYTWEVEVAKAEAR
ncbi:hypothetical protein [Thermus tengchongensis]|uniref:General secretion pathway protein GspL n=1 Tax=Thermus tengchongensis TaxID=1214928 RepID=A0ABY2K6V3_9DEIN|nr:hypothetical protein [Thermus tengchongensis]TFU16539.1 hypothetical protein E0489_05960 [Thermus tengchongensis]